VSHPDLSHPDLSHPDDAFASTGEPRVDEAVDRLRGLTGLPVAEHADVFDDVHRRLQDALAKPDGE